MQFLSVIKALNEDGQAKKKSDVPSWLVKGQSKVVRLESLHSLPKQKVIQNNLINYLCS